MNLTSGGDIWEILITRVSIISVTDVTDGRGFHDSTSVQNFGSWIAFCVDSDGTEFWGAYLVKISAFELTHNPADRVRT